MNLRQKLYLWLHILLDGSNTFNRPALVGIHGRAWVKMPHTLEMLRYHDKWCGRFGRWLGTVWSTR